MRQTTLEKIEEIKKREYGVEIEMCNLSRRNSCEVVAEYFHTDESVCNAGGYYNKWTCDDRQGRTWTFMSDSSIDGYDGCEMVTPLLTYEDLPDLQAIVRLLRKHGAISNPEHGCGVHIHVDVEDFDVKGLINLTNLIASHEALLNDAINTDEGRTDRWARAVPTKFLQEINKQKPETRDALMHLWYSTQGYSDDERTEHYSQTRYHLLNFHSLWQDKGIEFRCFQFCNPNGRRRGGLHAGEMKAYIQLCLALCETARTATAIKSKPSKLQTDNPAFAMKRFLRKLGLKGKEFATLREVMFRNLEGDARIRHVA